ncbi:MAG TPA: hypothetical protein VFQ88_04030 [Nevskiaceae bacterium]|nr:hypothetical protein [Nevskiaceae bacterium]
MPFPDGHSSAEPSDPGGGPVDEHAKDALTLIYLLFAVGFFIPILYLAGVIVAYVKKSELVDPLGASHLRWQIRTFWFGLLWGAIGGITTFIGIGFVILIVADVWIIYRIVKGWLSLNEGRLMYVD